MNLDRVYSKGDKFSYLTFEFDNNTYPIMNLEEKDYKSISSKTDFTKQSKTFILVAFGLSAIISSSHASLELDKKSLDTFDSRNPSFVQQKINLINNNLVKERTWIDDFLINAKNLKTPKDLFPYYSKINSLMIEKKFGNYDEILDKVEVKELNETLIIALLRLSFVWKDEIRSWNDFLDKAIIELDSRGHDSKKILVGLN